ncbi:PGAP1-domain-containing protein [Saitoella complicata NRRL Y-17804]|uniref:GPI inositol-deacylase n=1 Tax=Saitoella complicata (strain BCRC 22490 / CBS 7301 / JCM 7358 / NBRC 10748 / NRRL Y-17804) TaxID=698492 RepID=A0A0E9N806_SAICN|nr:PGAP1-domain-containing protein [Saitoella complicata NRRL Y-17804]ODQ54467.1 PGAP1-domain-containing protein [Saitoella complicata NRRL Y-17804]GAO45923.1 hypothetical protein G7K_0169-t1 [Saitoella complicata NRRL Y-17804]
MRDKRGTTKAWPNRDRGREVPESAVDHTPPRDEDIAKTPPRSTNSKRSKRPEPLVVDPPLRIDKSTSEVFEKDVLSNEPKKRPPPRGDTRWSMSLLLVILTLLSVCATAYIVDSFLRYQRDDKGCRMSWMSPSYARLTSFDTEHTRFASKYSLYLYREQGVDIDLKPNGVPVLFIPGNAGSYKQVRPIAAEAANQYAEALKLNSWIADDGKRNLDFFTVNFNEEFSAFHGQTLLDQAEYLNEAVSFILSLYHDTRQSSSDTDLPDPTSVIVIGHSMGGIVARTMLTLPNYQSNSVNTILTMSAPHAAPPVPFDWDIHQIYATINDYWRKSFAEDPANNPLWQTSLISVAGGGLDTVVASDYTSTASLLPDSHGFTVFTSSVPNVWTSMDHQAILWCDQFRKVVAGALLEVVDARRPGQTQSRERRMGVFRKWFLTGLEQGHNLVARGAGEGRSTILALQDTSHEIVPLGERLILRQLGDHSTKVHLLPVPPSMSHPGFSGFSLITDQKIGSSPGLAGVRVLLCSVLPLDKNDHHIIAKDVRATELACRDASSDTVLLPSSNDEAKHPFSGETFSYLTYDIDRLGDRQFVAVIDQTLEPSSGFLVAEFFDKTESEILSEAGFPYFLHNDLEFTLTPKRPIVVNIRIPAIDSSLLAYTMIVGPQVCDDYKQIFAPLVRQYITNPHESKFFVNVHQADINLHGDAPFMVPVIGPGIQKGVTLQFWTDPSCSTPLSVIIKLDIRGSFGKLVMRFRTAFAAFPLIIICLTLRRQFVEYDGGQAFMSFAEGLSLVVRDTLPYALVAVSISSLVLALTHSHEAMDLSSIFHHLATSSIAHEAVGGGHIWRNDILLGLHNPHLWFLAPLFVLISVGTCVLLYVATMLIVNFLHLMSSIPLRKYADAPDDQKVNNQTSYFAQSTPRRRLITTLVLLFFVATFVPYQFAYIVACIVQVLTCTRALGCAKDQGNCAKGDSHWDFFNYTHSILVLMLWLLPVNIPVLVVWVRNLAVQWLTPFSSHHNVLSVAPFILLVETLTAGKMIPRTKTRPSIIVRIILLCFATIAALWGVMHAYVLHHLGNILASWLVILHFAAVVGRGGRRQLALYELFSNDEKKKP